MQIEIDAPFHPATGQAAQIAHLFRIGLVMSYCIFGLVSALVAYAVWKFRERGRIPPQISGGKWAERGWTVTPLLLLAAMFVLTTVTVTRADPQPPRDPEVIAIGHQWWWEFRYPGSNVTTAYELHIPVGRNLATRLQAADVIHDFAVMEFPRKMDAIPGYWNYFWIGSEKARTYQGFCHEYCRAEHAWMLFKVIAQPEPEFDAWLRAQQQTAPAPETDSQRRGMQLIEDKSCAGCHTIRGTDAKGTIGPDLTHVATRGQLGSGIIDNTPENLFRWLKNPQAVKPRVNMPDTQLSDDDAHALVDYLETLK